MNKPAQQTYECSRCHKVCPTVFNVFLHIYTEHMGVNIALPPGESRQLLRGMEPYRMPIMRGCN